MTLRFGTDGVRGVANLDLTPELVTALGRAAARVLRCDQFVIGRDTRISGPLLEVALAAGLASEGVAVSTMGVVPTPAVAWTAAHEQVGGAMISASHNKYPDNGIKLFAPGGRKLRDEVEAALENELDRLVKQGHDASSAPTGDAVGTITAAPEHLLGYADSVVDSLEGRDLGGLSVVVDCANPTARTSTRPADRPTPTIYRRRCATTTPTSGWRSTVMPTACWPSTPRATSSTAIRSSPSPRSIFESAGACATTSWSSP